MGTSAFSNGPGGGVPFDPPWIDDIGDLQPEDEERPDSDGTGNADGQKDDQEEEQTPQCNMEEPKVASPGRFRNSRRELHNFMRTGDRESFGKAIGHYSRTGMGGARNAANRMRVSTKSAANLFGFLQSVREGVDLSVNEWVAALTSRNANPQEIIDEIINRVAPNDGSLEETSCVQSMALAMGDLLEKNPNIDLFHLEDRNIWSLIESFLAYEAFERLCLDIGQIFESSTYSPRDRVIRMNEMQDYLKAEISVQVEKFRKVGQNTTSSQLQVILQKALQNTFLVYEGTL